MMYLTNTACTVAYYTLVSEFVSPRDAIDAVKHSWVDRGLSLKRCLRQYARVTPVKDELTTHWQRGRTPETRPLTHMSFTVLNYTLHRDMGDVFVNTSWILGYLAEMSQSEAMQADNSKHMPNVSHLWNRILRCHDQRDNNLPDYGWNPPFAYAIGDS